MKRYILIVLLAGFSTVASAQSQKYFGNFSGNRSYYNPAFTGADGSIIKSYYRNQWTGFEDAPKTIMATGEVNLGDLSARKAYQVNKQNVDNNFQGSGVKHALGLQVLRESFGPYVDNRINLNYGAGLRVSEKLALRWGAALTYNSLALDGNKLTVDQNNDPKYTRLQGQQNRMGKLDLNLGLSLAATNYYIGYAMQDATQGKVLKTGDAFAEDAFTRAHIGQAGVRLSVTNSLGLVLNSMYQYDKNAGGTLDGQLKATYQDMFWLGGGYRTDQAYTATAGLIVGRLQVGYAYETPSDRNATINNATNEIMLGYRLTPVPGSRNSRQLTIW